MERVKGQFPLRLTGEGISEQFLKTQRSLVMKAGEKLVVVGCGGVGGPASVLSKKLMPDVEVTNVREEECFIVR